MSSVLPDMMDRLVALMEGSSSPERAMGTGRFQHVDSLIMHLLANTAQKPYPFEVIDRGEFQPADVPGTLAPDDIWHGCRVDVRVGYAIDPTDELERQKTIQRDRHDIRRVLGEPDNWDGVTGFSGVRIVDDDGPRPEVIPGSDNEVDVLDLLVIPIELTYREDHSS